MFPIFQRTGGVPHRDCMYMYLVYMYSDFRDGA